MIWLFCFIRIKQDELVLIISWSNLVLKAAIALSILFNCSDCAICGEEYDESGSRFLLGGGLCGCCCPSSIKQASHAEATSKILVTDFV